MASTTFEPRGQREDKGAEHLEKARQAGSAAVSKAQEAGREGFAAAKEAGADAIDKAKGTAADVVGKAKETVAAVGEMATQAASAAGQKADDLTSAAGHEIRGFGDTISKKAPHEGFAGAASQAFAEGVKGGGRYIEEAKLSGMAHDIEGVVRNHPIPSLLVCLGIGYCLGRLTKD